MLKPYVKDPCLNRDWKREEIKDSLNPHKAASLNILTSCWDLQNYIFCTLFYPYTKGHALKCVQQYIRGTLFFPFRLSKLSLNALLAEILSFFSFFFLIFAENSNFTHALDQIHLCSSFAYQLSKELQPADKSRGPFRA